MSTSTSIVCTKCNTPPRLVELDDGGDVMIACDCSRAQPAHVELIDYWTSSIVSEEKSP